MMIKFWRNSSPAKIFCLTLLIFGIILILVTISYVAHSKSCLKPDGDWVGGLTKQECKNIDGKWMVQK